MIKLNGSFSVFIVESITKAKAFYLENFDFQVAFENDWYLHLVSNSGIQVGFMLPDQPTQPAIFQKPLQSDGVILSVEVDNVDDAYSAAQAAELEIVSELKSEDWGQRHFVVKDPNGVYIDIVQAIEPTEEYQGGYDTK